jgi:hypothetical protein
MIDSQDRRTLRSLASRWMELASLPIMAERKRLWTALKNLQPERPMVLFEVWTLGDHFVHRDELQCSDPHLRAVELTMQRYIRQVEEVGDDLVLEPCWRMFWQVEASNYGVEIIKLKASDAHQDTIAYAFNHPIRTPQDVALLKARHWKVKRHETLHTCELLNDAFGDILPVQIAGMGGFWNAMTADLFKLIGNDNLLLWMYDAPEALHTIMAYLLDDRNAYYRWLESEGVLGLNNPDFIGSGSPGYTTILPQPGYSGQARLKDLWVWMESQETSMISPRLFGEFFLPFMAKVANLFGLVYYGCCEPVHDRWDRIISAMPNIRAVSVSPWCDQYGMAEKLGRTCVFSRKPKPWLISEHTPDWVSIQKDLNETFEAARDNCLEIIYRDVYQVSHRTHLRRWVEMVRAHIGGE